MIFITPNLTTIFAVNHKCGFSTFKGLASENLLHLVYFDEGFYIDHQGHQQPFCKESVVCYATMRDPYRRLLSFYNDKFINCFLPGSVEAGKQTCQQSMFKFFDEEKIRALQFSFSDLIDAIQKGYDDVHLYPQSNIIRHLNLNAQHILNIDRPDFNTQCKNICGLDMPLKNKSIRYAKGVPYAQLELIEDQVREFIRHKYREDFQLFQQLR